MAPQSRTAQVRSDIRSRHTLSVSRMRILRMFVVALLLVTSTIDTGQSVRSGGTPARPAATYSTRFVNAEALDACPYYSAADWNTVFLHVSNLYGVGFYLGGDTADAVGCYEASATWVSNLNDGWKLEPIWDGVQAPCSGNSHRMSSDGDTAHQQGVSAANNALVQANNVRLGAGIIIYYDMEGYSSSCEGPVKRFVDGWVQTLHNYADQAGLYGSVCSPDLDDYYGISDPPDDVAIAQRNGKDNASSVDSNCIAGDHWTRRRIHQYTLNSKVTAGGVTLNLVDHECVNGQLDGTFGYDNACGWPN